VLGTGRASRRWLQGDEHVDFVAEGRLLVAVVAISRGGGLFIGGGGHGKKRKESVGSGGEGAGRLTVPTHGGVQHRRGVLPAPPSEPPSPLRQSYNALVRAADEAGPPLAKRLHKASCAPATSPDWMGLGSGLVQSQLSTHGASRRRVAKPRFPLKMWDMSMPVISMVLVSRAHFESETAIGRSGIMDVMKKLLHGLVGGMAPGLSSFLNHTELVLCSGLGGGSNNQGLHFWWCSYSTDSRYPG
jgi:hypothetical protein